MRELRLEHEMTREKLAYENDVNKGTVSDLEKGLARPSVVTLKRLADGLGVELLDLFYRPSTSLRHRLVDLSRSASDASIRSALSVLERGAAAARPRRR